MRLIDFLAEHPDLLFVALILVEITVVGLISLAAMRLARWDAATRYGIGIASLALIALTVPATWLLQRTSWSTIALNRAVNVSPSAGPWEATNSAPLPIWIWAWSVGTALLFVRIGLGAWRVHRQRSHAVQVESLNGVSVCVTDDVGPAAIGVFSPAILVPRDLFDRLEEDEVRDVLTHEFEHVVHRHLLVAFCQRFLAGVFWPHPLVHLINRQVVLAREEVCDNAVLRSAGAARFARVLLRVAECRQGPRQFSASMGLFDPPTSLEERVKGLLDPNRRIDSKMNKRYLTLASLALLLGVAAVAGARIQTQLLVGAARDGYSPNPQTPKAKVAKRKKAGSKVQKPRSAVPGRPAFAPSPPQGVPTPLDVPGQPGIAPSAPQRSAPLPRAVAGQPGFAPPPRAIAPLPRAIPGQPGFAPPPRATAPSPLGVPGRPGSAPRAPQGNAPTPVAAPGTPGFAPPPRAIAPLAREPGAMRQRAPGSPAMPRAIAPLRKPGSTRRKGSSSGPQALPPAGIPGTPPPAKAVAPTPGVMPPIAPGSAVPPSRGRNLSETPVPPVDQAAGDKKVGDSQLSDLPILGYFFRTNLKGTGKDNVPLLRDLPIIGLMFRHQMGKDCVAPTTPPPAVETVAQIILP